MAHLHHFLHGVCQRDGDSQGEALRHSHHHNGDGVQEELHRAILVDLGDGETLVLHAPAVHGGSAHNSYL
jgi:hypothetical protein